MTAFPPPARASRDGAWLARAFVAALAAGALGLALWGGTPGDVRLVPCPFRTVTGLPCPGCGMTRAILSLAAGDPAAAWRLHPFSYALVILAVAVAVWPGRVQGAWRSLPRVLRETALGLALSAVLTLWVFRLAG